MSGRAWGNCMTWRILQLAFQLVVCDKGARYPPPGESSRVKDLQQTDLHRTDKGSNVLYYTFSNIDIDDDFR